MLKVFFDPFVVKVNGKKRIIFILRTNNILENHLSVTFLRNGIHKNCLKMN